MMNDPRLTAVKNEVVQLAVAEEHDADIPTNQGWILSQSDKSTLNSPLKSPFSTAEKDVEKGEVSPFSKASSIQSHKQIDDNTSDDTLDHIVWWDGDDDPENPMNWPAIRRWTAVSIVSGITFITPLGSSIFVPGVNLVMDEFGSDSGVLSGFVVSVYVLGFAFGPLGMFGICRIHETLVLTITSHCSNVRDVW